VFYSDGIEELKDLNPINLLQRTFRVYKFNDMGATRYIYLQNHIEARKNDLLGDGGTEFNKTEYQSRLKLRADEFNCAIEGKHFEVKIDGEIKWLF
jgi:ethanolamine utilization protein EutQ (cupin superfamily)